MAGDATDVKRVESHVEAPSHGAATAVRDQTKVGEGSKAPWTPSGIDAQHSANMASAGWKPAENLANVPANGPIYRAATTGLLGDLNPGAPSAASGTSAVADKGAVAVADQPHGGGPAAGKTMGAMATMGRGSDAVRPGAETPQPGAAQPVDAVEQHKQIEAMLQRPGNQKLSEQVSQMQANINKMEPPSSRETAQKGLEQMLARGLEGPHDINAPKLDTQKITDTLGNLNRAMGADTQHLSSLMGSDQPPAAGLNKSEREMNRDLIVAQALRSYGDSRSVQQMGHQTCLLDGKIGDQARVSPDSSSKVIADAVTSQNGKVSMADGTQVKLNDSFMRPDSTAWHSTGGENAQGMSGDVRLLTGIYANAITQQRGQEFRMSADGAGSTGQNDTGDRLIDMRSGRALATSSDGRANLTGTGRYIDSPNVGLNDSLALNKMTGDGGIVVSNQRWQQGGVTPSGSYKNVETAGDLQNAFAQSKGSVQVGLNAHILFGSGGVGAEGGGHLTSINGMSADGKMVHIQDTNNGTSGWYSTDRVVAAIKNDKSFDTTPRQGEDASIFNRVPHTGAPSAGSPERLATPGSPGGEAPRGGVSTAGDAPVRGGGLTPSTAPDTVNNPRGMLDGNQRDDNLKNAKPETDAQRQSREQEQKDQEEKNRAGLWKMLEQQEKARRDQEEAERRRQQGLPN